MQNNLEQSFNRLIDLIDTTNNTFTDKEKALLELDTLIGNKEDPSYAYIKMFKKICPFDLLEWDMTWEESAYYDEPGIIRMIAEEDNIYLLHILLEGKDTQFLETLTSKIVPYVFEANSCLILSSLDFKLEYFQYIHLVCKKWNPFFFKLLCEKVNNSIVYYIINNAQNSIYIPWHLLSKQFSRNLYFTAHYNEKIEMIKNYAPEWFRVICLLNESGKDYE